MRKLAVPLSLCQNTGGLLVSSVRKCGRVRTILPKRNSRKEIKITILESLISPYSFSSYSSLHLVPAT